MNIALHSGLKSRGILYACLLTPIQPPAVASCVLPAPVYFLYKGPQRQIGPHSHDSQCPKGPQCPFGARRHPLCLGAKSNGGLLSAMCRGLGTAAAALHKAVRFEASNWWGRAARLPPPQRRYNCWREQRGAWCASLSCNKSPRRQRRACSHFCNAMKRERRRRGRGSTLHWQQLGNTSIDRAQVAIEDAAVIAILCCHPTEPNWAAPKR